MTEAAPEPEFIWYTSYGSNLSRHRFMAYIVGCRPPGDPDFHQPGCTDKTPPSLDIALKIPQSLYFARFSERRWGGTAAAFITLEKGDKPSLARAYLITLEQFKELVQQENAGVPIDKIELDIVGARQFGHSRMLPSGYYDELIYCGDRDGCPMLSFTASQNWTEYTRPSESYLRMIFRGLQEAHHLSLEDAIDYLKNTPGVPQHYSALELRSTLQGP